MSQSQLEVSPGEYRRALGAYPTGVAVITAREANGENVAMVVGTFTSVSLDPPLIGFLPDRASTSWPRIRDSGRFCVNVLNAQQEEVCRAFATKAADRWERHVSSESHSGTRLEGVTLYIECEIADVLPAGDHEFVLGSVKVLEVSETAGMPLLFLRGGYGAPSVPSIQMEVPGFADQLRMADLVRPEIEALAAELGLECRVTARNGDRVVILAAAGIGAGAKPMGTTVGTSLPLIAPLAPLFVADAPTAERERWLRAGQAAFGEGITALAEDLVERARSGWEEVANHGLVGDIEGLLDDDHGRELDNTDLREFVQRFPVKVSEGGAVGSMAVPVRDPQGHTRLVLQLVGFGGNESQARLASIRGRLQEAATNAAERLI